MAPRMALLVVLTLWRCLDAAAAQAGPADGVLRFGVHVSQMGDLDPHLAAGSQDRAFADLVFNGLLRYRPGNAPDLEPDLAAAMPQFEMIDGLQVWTVHLRAGVRFHPGPLTPATTLTADDVVFSLRKAADKALSSYAGEYAGMAFEAVDPQTVRITLERPLSTVLFLPKFANYGGGFIVSRRAVEAMGLDGFRRHPVGTGPFAFNRHLPGESLLLDAHPDYFRGRPRLAGVEFRFAPDGAARGAALVAGTLDVIYTDGTKGWLERMQREKDLIVDTHGVGEITTIFFNTRIPPFDDLRVRKAVAHALDRKMFMDTVDAPYVQGSAFSPVPADLLPGGMTRAETQRLGLTYDTDLTTARRLLTEAGYPEGFSISLVSSQKRMYRRYYEALQGQLARIGIDCRIDFVPHGEMHRRIRSHPQPIVIYVAWRPNADAYLTQFFHSASIVLTGRRPDTNFSGYDKVDRLIEAARAEIDPARQTALWVQAQIRILSDMAALPVMTTRQCYLRRAAVDYGHPLVSTMALYPQFTERTRFIGGP